MWQNPKVLQSTAQCLHPPTPTQIQNLPTSPSPSPIVRQCLKLSRRELTVSTKSSLLLLLASQVQDTFCLSKARAEETLSTTEKIAEEEEKNPINNTTTTIDAEENLATTNKIEEAEENPINNNTTTDAEEKLSNTNKIAEEENPINNTTTTTDGCTDKIMTKRAFLDISIDGEPIGRIIIGLYGDNVPAGTARFSDLVSGAAGVSYRRKEFIKITPDYIQHGGVRSYGVDAELAAKTGRNLAVDNLINELETENGSKCTGKTKNLAGSVGIIVRDPLKPPPKLKLVARKGKLEIDEEEEGKEPNGTEFVIATKDSPELDAAALVVGRVVEGMEVVERIGKVKTVQENTTSPYFRVAKLIGDKRAVVAERGFNRPYSKVVVTNCGLMT